MKEKRNAATYYVNAIIKDIQNAFVNEETLSFSQSKIVREYEFEDGAIIKYEWQSEGEAAMGEPFNHRFTLQKTPNPNEQGLKIGVLKVITY